MVDQCRVPGRPVDARLRHRKAEWRTLKEADMDDAEIVQRISKLAEEERELEKSHAGSGLSEDHLRRLRAVEVALDQCWDLLRQRRARRGAGTDPDAAEVRAEDVVEGYRQ
jgi:hypothetical protein